MKKPKTRKDFGILIAILIVVVAFAIAVTPFVISLVNTGNYKKYVERFTDGINSSHPAGTVIVTKDGETIIAPISSASRIYSFILSAGMGKVQKKIPEGPAVVITFKDGSSVEFREAVITEKSAQSDKGLFIRFTDPEGKVYQYDTDKLKFESVLQAIPGLP